MNLSGIQLNKQTKILAVLFAALIVYLDAAYILKAQSSGLKRLDAKTAKLNLDLANLNRGLESMQSMRLSKGVPMKAFQATKIIPDGQVPGLLQEISAQANKREIKIIQMSPVRPAQKEKSAAQNKAALLLINLELSADYHNLGRFIQALESSAVFMQVQELKIATQAQEPDYLKQQIRLVLKTYVAK